MHSLATLQKLTLEWSEARGITTNGKAITQVCKLTEEFCETLLAISQQDIDEVKDGLGDCLVVCCNLAVLINSKLDFQVLKKLTAPGKQPTKIYEALAYSYGKLTKTVNANRFEEADIWLQEVVILIYVIAYSNYTTPEECWTLAYNVIKDRKGYLTPEGNFIKESDL